MGAIDTCQEADMRRVGEFGKMEGLIFRRSGKFWRGWDGGGCLWTG